MTIRTKFTEFLGIEHPLMLAPMGTVAGSSLAAAVSNAGGLGMIGVGYGDIEWLKTELDQISKNTNKPWGVGFITWCLTQEVFDLVMQYSPNAIMFSFGDMSPWVQQVKDRNIAIFCQVQDLHGAIEDHKKGADFIVAQGTEAGGHGKSHRTTLSLIRGIKTNAPEIKIIAAGGIADGEGFAAAINLGAEGVSMGTRFYATFEANAHIRLKQRLVECNGDDTIRTHIFDVVREIPWPRVYTGRAITNKFVARWHQNEHDLRRFLRKNKEEYFSAQEASDPTITVVWAGESIDAITDITEAGKIVRRIISSAEKILN